MVEAGASARCVGFRFQLVGWLGAGGIAFLVLITGFRCLERGGHVKDWLTVLNGRYASRTEIRCHLKILRRHKQSVLRYRRGEGSSCGMNALICLPGQPCCVQRLSHDLPTEDLA